MEESSGHKSGHSRNGSGNGNTELSSSLRSLLEIVFRRKRLVRNCFIGLVAGAVLAILFVPSTYEAEMKILVERERVDPVVTTQANVQQQALGLTEDEVISEVQLFQTRDSLEKAVVACGLYKVKPHSLAALKQDVLGFVGLAPDKKKRIYQAVLTLSKNLHVIPVDSSNLIKVAYDSSSPQMAARVLNVLGNLYIAKHAAVYQPKGTSQFFAAQAQQYRDQLSNVEGRLVDFDRTSGSVLPAVEEQVIVQRISNFEDSLVQTRASLAETKHRLAALKEQENMLAPRITTQVKVGDNSELMASLKSTLLNLELKRTELLEKYAANYPPVKEVEQEISEAIASIRDAEQRGIQERTTDVDPTYQWIETEMAKDSADLTGLEARQTVMTAALRTMATKALHLDRASQVQQDLTRTVKADEASYLLYYEKGEQARIDDALDQQRIVNAAIAEQPVVPMVPIGLSLAMQLVLSILCAGLISLGVAFAAEYIDPSFRTPTEVDDCLGVPLLASIPKNGH